nr:retrovirus-related Pol polyprotein from transposon TNT 1-94 [Tanacetum cinerariifolium]
MSATEAEYIAASQATMEAVWIRKFISGLGIVPIINEPIRMFCDNSAALHFANEPRVQRGTRHYHRGYHYVRESIALGEIRLLKVHTDDNLADPFTKALYLGVLQIGIQSQGFIGNQRTCLRHHLQSPTLLSVPEPIYLEYIPLEDEHILPAEEQPLLPVVSPTTKSPEYVVESDPEEDLEEYEDDETEDGLVDHPMGRGDDGDDDDGESSGYDADDEDEDEEEEEHLAPADSAAVPEMAPTTLEGVNTRVTELVELHEHDTQDLYALLEDAQDETDRVRQSQIVETLRVMRDIRREVGDMQAELLALRRQPRRAGQPGGND